MRFIWDLEFEIYWNLGFEIWDLFGIWNLRFGIYLEFGIWNLRFIWNLEFGIYLEFGIWNLRFGISCGVWRALAEYNVPVMMLPERGKGVPALMGSALSGSVENRMAHYNAANSKKWTLPICRWLLLKKLKGQWQVLRQMGADSTAEKQFRLIMNCQTGLRKVSTRNQLMGYEGTAANAYFKVWKKILPKSWKFSGRNRRPPKDPVNAMLSLGYVIAGSEVRSVVQERGLDPSLGILHVTEPGRESFVLDVIEPLRPAVDRFVLRLINDAVVPEDFNISTRDGCRLNKNGRKVFYNAWASWQNAEGEHESLRSMAKDIVRDLLDFFGRHDIHVINDDH